jgi:hypothetical protein
MRRHRVGLVLAGAAACAVPRRWRPPPRRPRRPSAAAGTWGTAIEVPGSATLFSDKFGSDALVSCATAGNCAVGLIYTESVTGKQHVFVASEVDGTWGNATDIPGLATLNADGNASITSVSCGAAGNCAAAGTYTDGSGHTQAFVASQA